MPGIANASGKVALFVVAGTLCAAGAAWTIQFEQYGRLNAETAALAVVEFGALLGLVIYAYNPARGMMCRKGGS